MKDEKRFTLRLPTELHARLVKMARNEQRSVNQMIKLFLQKIVIEEKLRKK
jgi:predicted HicB family RNase H-like nuclease